MADGMAARDRGIVGQPQRIPPLAPEEATSKVREIVPLPVGGYLGIAYQPNPIRTDPMPGKVGPTVQQRSARAPPAIDPSPIPFASPAC